MKTTGVKKVEVNTNGVFQLFQKDICSFQIKTQNK